MSDKKVEDALVKAFNGLKNLQREQEEKQYQKHWGQRKFPFTLLEGLGSYTKADLDDIRKKLVLKNASSLKKSELIALLVERIPENIENLFSLWDIERFKILTNIASNGGQIIVPNLEANQIEYFRDSGLVYTGTFEGNKMIAVPNEIIDPILDLQNNLKIRETVARNTEWIRLTNGLLYYYGTLSVTKLLEMLESYTKAKINIREYLNVIYEANTYRKENYSNEDGYSTLRVFDSKKVIKEQQARKTVPYFPFSKQQLLIAGEPGFVDRNISYTQLVNFLIQNFKINKVKADSIVEECVYATRIGHGPNDVLNYLSKQFEIDSLDTVKALMDKVVHLMHNTREWFLKGYTSTELSAQRNKYLKPLPTSKINNSDSEKIVKIGRNEPCPCGSGEKYKKCCGR
ncbi:SEC-C domain-containing protein [Bacillus sp. EB106-08-02-XG196]|uniref:YecA family protein n=1 Tax=Bacillus sp. EB106-08-02-XG196 TaxID=2737049 RepID=UPI0015C4683E|nr:SEC-C metal-binding domain-containing protein [Bacillus sp. EB106-08-02-XG196]NWQ44002.1 SEC-C domain-containing protein [Bacillus sp. EB106-08-02-XG196]